MEFEMSLPLMEKELVAVGISVAAGCKPCTDYHIRVTRESGATDDEIRRAITDAICVRASALKVMQAHGLQHLGDAGDEAGCGCEDTNRIKELISVGAAHAVNCTTNFEEHLLAAKTLGITDCELKEVIKLANFIQNKAASHVDKIARFGDGDAEPREQPKRQASAGCC